MEKRIGFVQKTTTELEKQATRLYKSHNKVELVIDRITYDNKVTGYFIVD